MTAEEEWTAVENMIRQLKNTCEFMIDLAYSALIFGDKELAERVMDLEEYMDKLHTKFELKVLEIGIKRKEDKKNLLGLLRLGVATENLADAAAEIADVVLRGVEPHPILRMVMEEAEETVMEATISENSTLNSKMLGEIKLDEKIGVKIIAVKREDIWFYNPPDDFILRTGDIIVARGFIEAKDALKKLAEGID
ncbi:MAG: potassium channel family protein [Candidatus Baldrarchaeia archaeon]